MAAQGSSDSAHTKELEVPLFLFSFFFFSPPEALLNRLMLYSQHNIIHSAFTSVTGGLQHSSETPADQHSLNRQNRRGPMEKVFSVSADEQLADEKRRDLFMSIKSCTHVYLTYISLSTHPAVKFGKKRKDNSEKRVSVEAWLQQLFFPFSALYGVCQTQWTRMRRKVWLSPPYPSAPHSRPSKS